MSDTVNGVTTRQGGSIKAGDASTYSKFEITINIINPETDINTKYTYTCNSDVRVKKFWTAGSENHPPDNVLFTIYPEGDFGDIATGFDSFSGSIGAKKIYIKTGKGIVTKGDIEGGPEEGQTIRGSGTWLSS